MSNRPNPSSHQAVTDANAAAMRAADDYHPGALSRTFTSFASYIARASGRPATFVLCCALIVIWAATGPIFHYSDTWQLIINTSTTIITFLMVFLIQNTQNRDGAALQAKLDELIRAHHDARNDYMGIEKLPEEQLTELREHCADVAEENHAGESAGAGR